MQFLLLDFLACPVCGSSPFSLVPLVENGRPSTANSLPAAPLTPSFTDIQEGILQCHDCSRWFPIRNGIPDLVRDGLRDTAGDLEFLRRHRDRLPSGLLESGVPLNLNRTEWPRSESDGRIVEEGVYWGEFMEAYWNVGDRSIFDVRVNSTHPAFYGAGVLECDERDRDRRCGLWPDHLGAIVFGWMAKHRGDRALDVGCGGGQYGLEAARNGLEVVGIDPSRRALELARLHALETGATLDYIRADPAEPPFLPSSFDVLMAKDSLHHVPDLDRILDRLDSLLRPGGTVAIHEHIGRSNRKRKILAWLQPRLIPRIQKRYGTVEVPAILLRESPNEDVGMTSIEPGLRRRYTPLRIRRELFLYYDVEEIVYYASGKRKWLSGTARIAAQFLEALLLMARESPEHLSFIGRKPESPSSS